MRRAVLWVVGVVVGIVVLLGAFGALRLTSVAGDLEDAADLLDRASANIEAGELAVARAELTDAQALLVRANSRLYNHPSIDLLGALPVAKPNLEALREVVGLALRMADGGGRLLAVTEPYESPEGTLEIPLRGGAVPLDAVRQSQVVARELANLVPSRGYRPDQDGILGPVKRAQDIVYGEVEARRAQLDSVSRGLGLLTSLAGDGERHRYLIAVANTAEMRGAGGMILSYGILESENGVFSLGDFGGIDELFLNEPVDPDELELPADYLRRWDGLDPTRLWRNVTVHPNFAFDARIMVSMFAVRTLLPLDGVIQIDPSGLAAILSATGPVNVDGVGAVDAGNVVDLTLNRAYTDFPDRDQRQEVLGDVAEAAFEALVSGEFGSMRALGEALFEAAQQRHIIVHLVDGEANRDAESFGATGEIPPPDTIDYLLLTVQNLSANKLDYYLDTELAVTGDRPGGEPGTVQATITVTNTAPPGGGAPYVFGPNAPGQEAGLYRGLVSLYVPTGTTLVDAAGDSVSAPVLTTEAGRTVVGFDVDVPAGERRTVTLDLALAPRPAGAYELTLVPVPRVRPTVVSADIEADGERVRRPAAPLLVAEVQVAGP